MKITCVKTNLKDALLIAERFTGKQLSLPVLRYVLLIASEGKLRLRATNLDLGIEIEIPAKIEKEGIVAVPADVLGGYLSNLVNEKNITLEQVMDNLSLSGSSYSTLIKGFNYDDFPTLPFITKGTTFQIPAKSLLSGFRSTQYATAVNDIKPEFSSVYCYTDDQSIIFVATDSLRLAEKRIQLKNIPNEGFHVLIPGKNVTEIIRAFENIDDVVDVCATQNQITFRTPHIHITSRLIDGVFPDYKQIIPKQFTTEVVLLRQDFVDNLKLTTIFSGKTNQVRLKIYPSEKLFEIESQQDGIGETSQQIDATLKGENVDFLFNQRHFTDVLSYLSTDSVSLSASGDGRPLVIRGIGDHSFCYLVIPMMPVNK